MKNLIDAACGRIKSDLVLKNGNVIDVFCDRIIKCDVAIKDGIIVGLGEYEGEKEVDISDKYVVPGFIDAHVHIESSMLTPSEYAKVVLPKGVTTIIADPHEIVNVCGEDGLRFMIADSKTAPLDVEYMLPSCVPATPFDHSGCVIDGDMTNMLLDKYDLLGLGEMMNYPGVIFGDEDVLKKLNCGKIIDGHAPRLDGKDLCGYICGGISTDHECTTYDEAIEKVSRGIMVLIREGTGAKNLEELVKAVTPYNKNRFAFCTDDKHLDDILKDGTISYCVNKAIDLGLEPVTVFYMASKSASDCYGLEKGAIAPNYIADLMVCGDLNAKDILQVYKDGVLVAENGKVLFDSDSIVSESVLNTVNIDEVNSQALNIEFDSRMPVIELSGGSLITKGVYQKNSDGLSLCANIERHHRTGNMGKCYVKGFSAINGAVAQTIGHDSHNITVVGSDSENMAIAVNALGKEGGIVVVKDKKVVARLELGIGGLMSTKRAEVVAPEHNKLLEAVKSVSGDTSGELLMILAFISLLVIPDIKLGDRGLFDVTKFKYI